MTRRAIWCRSPTASPPATRWSPRARSCSPECSRAATDDPEDRPLRPPDAGLRGDPGRRDRGPGPVLLQPAGHRGLSEPGAAEEVERYVTVPLENGLNGMIDLDHIRSQSLFGLSDVKCYFTWNADYHMAQQRVLNRLGFVTLPPGMTPQLSPWSAIGEVYRYVVRGDGYTLADLKTAEDWILERQF